MRTSSKTFQILIRNSPVIVFMFFCCFDAVAHEDLLKRILSITEEIKAQPDSAYLYFKRGKLYYQHNDFNSSLKDLKSSQKLGFNSNEQYFLLAKNHSKFNHFNTSKRYVDKILKDQPNNVNAFKLLGQLNFKKRKFKKSVKAYEKVIIFSKETFPENYLDASKAWYALRTENGTKRAQLLLIKGIEDLGDNILLYDKLISINVDLGDYSSAIKFQKKVIDFSHRKERGYLKLANLQILEKNYSGAIVSIKKAQKFYKSLPERIKGTKFMREFYSELELKNQLLKKENVQGI